MGNVKKIEIQKAPDRNHSTPLIRPRRVHVSKSGWLVISFADFTALVPANLVAEELKKAGVK